MPKDLSNIVPGTDEDWQTEDPTKITTNKDFCGKSSRITLYANGTFLVSTNYCHRWDCEYCAARRTAGIKKAILQTCAEFHWAQGLKPEDDYGAIKKRIERNGSKWVAVGTSKNGWIVFTEKPIIKNSRVVPKEIMAGLIDHALKGEYTFNERRLRHSEGLFPPYVKGPEEQGYIVVRGNPTQVREKLTQEGYTEYWMKRKIHKGNGTDGADIEVEANMVDAIRVNGWFKVLAVRMGKVQIEGGDRTE